MGDSSGADEHEHEQEPATSAAPPAWPGPMAGGTTDRGRRIALRVLMVLALLTMAWIASPFWFGILLGAVMAFSTQLIHAKLVAKWRGRDRLAAAAVTLGSGIVLAAMGFATVYVLTGELVDVLGTLEKHVSSDSLPEMLGQRGAEIADRLGLQRPEIVSRIHNELASAAGVVTRIAGAAAGALSHALLGYLIALLTMYYVLIDGPRLSSRLERIVPLDPRHTRALFREFREVGRSALLGTVFTAFIQGVLGAIGFAIAGVPHPVTWGVLTAVASFLPLVGTTLVWIPVGVYQLLTGEVGHGIFTLAWGALIVASLSDYVIRPRIVGKMGRGSPLLMLIALLGGIEVLGLPGLIVGPILMSLFLAVLRIYERELDVTEQTVVQAS